MDEGAANHGGIAGGTTALGVALEPGERVLWADKPDHRTERVIFAVLGVIFLVVVVGVVLLLVAYLWPRWQPRGVVLTDRRVIAVDRHGAATSAALGSIRGLRAVRVQSSPGNGGLLGALLGAAVDAAADSMADKHPLHDPAHWKRTSAIELALHDGRNTQVPTRRAAELGPLLVRLLEEPARVATLPTVPCDP